MPDSAVQPNSDFWKRKLAAFLHDPPCKPLDISRAHEEEARQLLKGAWPGFDEDSLRELQGAVRDADWHAAAADRFCFPKGKAPARFTGRPGATFRHPLGKAELTLDGGGCAAGRLAPLEGETPVEPGSHEAARGDARPPKCSAAHEDTLPELGQAVEWLQNAIGGVKVDESASEADQWRQRFFLYWRRFLQETVRQGGKARDMAYYPADTRIPDHTIWNHMSMASALEGCRVAGTIRPAFLILQIGPVQDFIAAARSTRDLWSGSYLLSWLTASGIKAVSDRLGPDAILFPALRGQGVFDILNRESAYSNVFYKAGAEGKEHSLWQRMYDATDDDALKTLLSPTLPNRFVALVPENRAAELGEQAEQAVRDALEDISDACFARFSDLAQAVGADDEFIDAMEERWQRQVDAFPRIAWAATPWQSDTSEAALDKALAEFAELPVNLAAKDGDWTPHRILAENLRIARQVGLPPNNPGFLWMLNDHRAEFALAARRNTREFDQWPELATRSSAPKDALTGKEEIIGDEDLWESLSGGEGSPFKKNEGPYGALSIIKRLWWKSETGFLPDCIRLDEKQDNARLEVILRFDSVADIAAANAGRFDDVDDNDEPKPRNPYVAVIALDGDEMGKWVSGAKAPKLLGQVADIARTYLEEQGVPDDLPRALTPSYHMQFSEALANFATHVADRIVRQHDGQLVYAGGDDVLAMVPATQAIPCARALRAGFRGCGSEFPVDQREYELGTTQDGFLLVGKEEYPVIVPGPAAEVSCGIAIAHYKHPLQAIVREAQGAEKRAKAKVEKGGYDRAAFAVSLLKRGGETIQWGAKWDSGALELYGLYCELRAAKKLSGRFPYALAGLLAPYELAKGGFDKADEIIRTELAHVMERQGNWKGKEDPDRIDFANSASGYLAKLPDNRLEDFVHLFLTAAFIERSPDNNPDTDEGDEQ